MRGTNQCGTVTFLHRASSYIFQGWIIFYCATLLYIVVPFVSTALLCPYHTL